MVASLPNFDLLQSAKKRLNTYDLYWLIGGARSGKSTLCQALAQRGFSVVDMDAKIYGSFHGRFDPTKHPANTAWSTAESSLGFLLALSWLEFDAFHRTAAIEYLDLLATELGESAPAEPMIVDGGLWHPAILAQVFPLERLVCVQAPHLTGKALWEGDAQRIEMRSFMNTLPDPEAAWETFLAFDVAITNTAVAESREAGIPILTRTPHTTVAELCEMFTAVVGD